MTPVRCIGAGDCWRSCIASILNLAAGDVPNFGELADTWDRMYELGRDWLSSRGLGIFRTYCTPGWTLEKLLEVFSSENADVPIIVSGLSRSNPQETHAIVAMNGKVVHDPSGAGVAGPCPCRCGAPTCDGVGYWWIDVIAFGHSTALQSGTLERAS